MIHLTRLNGFERNKRVSRDDSLITLGTNDASDLRFDPTWDKTVSPQHCTLERGEGSSWWVKDTSRDGVFVEGRKVSLHKIQTATVIELGRGGPKVRVEFDGPSEPASEPASAAPATPLAAPVPPTVIAVPAPPPSAAIGRGGSKLTPLVLILAVCAVVGLGALGYYFRDHLPFLGKTPEEALARQAGIYAEAVGLVVVTGTEGPQGFGTAWAIAPGIYATNAHVAQPIAELLKNGGTAYVAVNRRPDLRLRITRAIWHPRYSRAERNFEGKTQPVITYDVGLLYVQGVAPIHFRPAPRAELERLDSGYRIAFLGFPMEGLAGGNVDVRAPVATMQSGIITANTDYWMARGEYAQRFSIQHNLGATGGASGSPMFNRHGAVVGLLNAGNIIGSISQDGNVIRAPSAALVNYGQRVDLLRDIWADYPKDR
jgi:hypothetical protein